MAAPVATVIGTGTVVSGNPLVITLSAAVAAGESIVLRIANRTNRTVASITDTAGNSYVERVDISGGVGGVCIADCLNPSALSVGNAITITFSGSVTAYAIAQELGATCTYAPGSAASGVGNAANPSVTTGASVAADSLAVGVLTWGATTNAGVQSGWTGVAEANYGTRRFEAHDRDVTSAGTQTFAPTGLGSSNDYNIAVAAYTAPASSGQAVDAALFTNSQSFYGATVVPGPVDIAAALLTNTQAFHAATVTATYGISAALYSDPDTFWPATVSLAGAAPQQIAAALFVDPDIFFGATIFAESPTRTGDGARSNTARRKRRRSASRALNERWLDTQADRHAQIAEEQPEPAEVKRRASRKSRQGFVVPSPAETIASKTLSPGAVAKLPTFTAAARTEPPSASAVDGAIEDEEDIEILLLIAAA